jgi:threonine aldolase
VTDEEIDRLRASCGQAINGHGEFTAGKLLATIPPETVPDFYGRGGVVGELEAEVAALLGKPAALFVPSGTMAQQATLRVHADCRGSRVILFHPSCHLDRHEGRGYERLQRLIGRPVGDAQRLLGIDDLAAIAETPAALVLELPQRELGGRQPSWSDLQAQTDWARSRGAAAHLDGARLWESAVGYGRPPAEVAALFDSVYVSFYKGLGALTGCVVAADTDVIDQLAEWRKRMGGTLFALWPYAASAFTCLRARLPRMPHYLAHARAIAAALQDVPGVTVVPDPPQTPMMHLLLRTSRAAFETASRRIAEQRGLWSWKTTSPTDDPRCQRVELGVGDATCALTAFEIRDAIAELLQPA